MRFWIFFFLPSRQVVYEFVILFQRTIDNDGVTPIARLAAEQKWFAVQNLCRRRVVRLEEALLMHNGKNAIHWAVHHGQRALADEIEYLLVSTLNSIIVWLQLQLLKMIMQVNEASNEG
jgi:hypothetical protein